ncbi:MAG: aminotransferase class I/II-fold pyridoxal phosphate-dependent enzyme [Pseudomonadota bacterium]
MQERKSLAHNGIEWSELRESMIEMGQRDVGWRDGKAAVYIFHSGEEVMNVAHEAYGLYIAENGLGPAAFPSLKRMEQEVIQIALSLQNAPDSGTGSMTSGGSESILLAIKACRDFRARTGPVSGTPEIVAPYSVHPAFDKGAHMMGLKVVRVPCGDDFKADIGAMENAITENTIMLVGSAPCFPYGLIDPIEKLSNLAETNDLWLHVDACVGGYLNPFIAAVSDRDIETYDFSLPGVSSMSLDLHKYGYAAKGASTVLYRHPEYREAQIFDFDDWPCGQMMTPTFAGTRPGGAIAAAWAVLNHLGRAGYEARARLILDAQQQLIQGCQGMGLKIFGDPKLSIIAFGWDDGDILAAGEGLYQEGWFSSRLQDPDGIQYMTSPEHHKTMPSYLECLERCVAEVRSGKRVRRAGRVKYS